MNFKPRFIQLKYSAGTFGEQSKACANLIGKLYGLDTAQTYAMHDLFYALTYETKTKQNAPDKYNEMVSEKYGKVISAFGSEETFRDFLKKVAGEKQVIMMQNVDDAEALVDELTRCFDKINEVVGEKSLTCIFKGANFYNWSNIVPKEYREWYEREKSSFSMYGKANGMDILVGTLPRDFVSFYDQPNFYESKWGATKPSDTWKANPAKSNMKWVLAFIVFAAVMITIVLYPDIVRTILLHPNEIGKLISPPKVCAPGLNDSMCSPSKPLYCDNGKIIKRVDICGCASGLRPYGTDCILKVNCTDGTLSPDCSVNKPYQCVNGTLIENASKCGCASDYKLENYSCVKIPSCTDGTLYLNCSFNKPYQCVNGTLIEKASVCGCFSDYKMENEGCVKIPRCADGTNYGECSNNKPLFCNNGGLIDRASVCGCPAGTVIESFGDHNGDKCVLSRDAGFYNPSIPSDNSVSNLYDIESQVHALINTQRASNGLSPLAFDEKLASIARKHSQDMATRNYFEHDTPEGQTFSDRMVADGYNCAITIGNTIYGGAENIFKESGYSIGSVPSTTVDGWMSSPGHRANIVTPYWRNEGIGVAESSDGTIYVTQDFC